MQTLVLTQSPVCRPGVPLEPPLATLRRHADRSTPRGPLGVPVECPVSGSGTTRVVGRKRSCSAPMQCRYASMAVPLFQPTQQLEDPRACMNAWAGRMHVCCRHMPLIHRIRSTDDGLTLST